MLRLDYEDIRQRALYKMNGYEQVVFARSFIRLFDIIEQHMQQLGSSDTVTRKRFAKDLRKQAEKDWETGRYGGDIAREGAQASANALALHAVFVEAQAYPIAEAFMLVNDINAFKKKIEEYLVKHNNLYDMIPLD